MYGQAALCESTHITDIYSEQLASAKRLRQLMLNGKDFQALYTGALKL